MNKDVQLVLIIVGIVVVAFIALREILLWYWKISEVVQNQKKTNFLLARILHQNGGELSDAEKKWLELS
jgi:hypothetical protein